jgi:hypothetical protein
MAKYDPVPKDDADAAEYFDSVAWSGANAAPDVVAEDEHASDIANAPAPDPGLFHKP